MIERFDNHTMAEQKLAEIISTAQASLQAEAAGLSALQAELIPSTSLGRAFAAAVIAIGSSGGRVVVSGIGKSGHIGRKIQATLASTGTPAFFVHPTEAAHGDLGMIEKHDILLLLSYSGESSELAALLEHAARNGLTVLGITAQDKSALARASTIVLHLPPAREACPMGLAPTTSTLMQLALGDALALALLKQRGFTASDFRLFHPGGKLGTLLRPLRLVMHQGDALPLGSSDMSLSSIILEMTRKAFGCIGIIDETGALVGLISDGDLRPALMRDLNETRAQDIMNRSPVTSEPEIMVQEALHLMNARDKPITSLFVLDTCRRPVGIVHLHDLLRIGAA